MGANHMTDSMPTVYQRIKRIARPIVKFYHDDITVHDRRACDKIKRNDVAVWVARECGSHFIWVSRHDDTISADILESMRNALNWFDAVSDINQDAQWHMINGVADRRGNVCAIDTDYARDLFVRRIKGFERELQRAA